MHEFGQVFVFWELSSEQMKYFGKNISWLNCYRTANLCGRFKKHKINRPHLTCLNCKLRLVVTKKLPLVYPINVHQVWEDLNLPKFQQSIFRLLLTVIEFFSHRIF